MNGQIPEKLTVKFHNFFHTLKELDNQGQSEHEFYVNRRTNPHFNKN